MPRTAFVDLETARKAPGLRIVSVPVLPSPWSEAAKGLFEAKGLPYQVLRFRNDDAALAAWTGANNAPAVFYDDEPPRSGFREIVALAERLPGAIEFAPSDPALLADVAGEDGLGWCGRLLMMHAGFESDGARGFPVPVAKYLGAKYGYAAERIPAARARAREVLASLDARLGSSGGRYFGGDRLSAIDVYSATFLTMVLGASEEECPAMRPMFRPALAALAAELGGEVSEPLRAHRARMFREHLEWPIVL